MTTYFSDREFGSKPMVEETVSRFVWQAILSLIKTRADDGSLAYGFPLHCPDGNAIVGTDWKAMSNAIRAEIGDLADDGPEDGFDADFLSILSHSLPNTPAILDLLEFVARHVAQPARHGWHEFHCHDHLQLDRDQGLCKFVEDINRLFSRNGLAYRLTDAGVIERTVSAPMAELLKQSGFSTGDRDLDGLLDTAVEHFLLPKPEARQDAMEKLWDAFERLKTIEDPGDKKAGATSLIDRATACDAAVFRLAVTEEFQALTRMGNELRIRHSEVGKEPVGDNGEKDYLFMRLFSLIWFMLKGTERLSNVRNDHSDDDEAPFWRDR